MNQALTANIRKCFFRLWLVWYKSGTKNNFLAIKNMRGHMV
jgi:hypothetical protein